jgi:hypothetical protein
MTLTRTLFAVSLALAQAMPASADNPPLKAYGFVRLDGIFNDSPMNHPQFPGWVSSEAALTAEDVVAKDKGEINIHPRLTRVGLDVGKMTAGNGFTLAGKIEADFQNGGSESRQAVRMRHGYLTIARGVWEVLAGQTWDLISPLYPYVNNDSIMWNAGNAGDRRPQLRVTARPKAGDGATRVAVALGMPNAINNRDLDGNGVRDGAYAKIPAVQGLAELDLSVFLLGASAHFHRDRVVVDTGSGLEERDFDATLVGGHVKVPIGERVRILGEAFLAQNADDVRAGIGQGINEARGREIETVGSWGEVQVSVDPRWTIAAGATMDDPKDEDLDAGMRRKNRVAYGAVRLSTLERLQVGLEYLYWKTDYLDAPDGDANRVDLWGSMSF